MHRPTACVKLTLKQTKSHEGTHFPLKLHVGRPIWPNKTRDRVPAQTRDEARATADQGAPSQVERNLAKIKHFTSMYAWKTKARQWRLEVVPLKICAYVQRKLQRPQNAMNSKMYPNLCPPH